MTAKPNLIIFRPKHYRYSFLDYRIHINNVEAGTISEGQQKELSVPTGEHQLCVTIRTTGSAKEFLVKDGETVLFIVHTGLNKNPFSNLWAIFFGPNQYLELTELTKENTPQGQRVACERCGDFTSSVYKSTLSLCEQCFIRAQYELTLKPAPALDLFVLYFSIFIFAVVIALILVWGTV